MANDSRLQTLTVDQSDLWTQVLDQTGAYDFHHMPSYHRLSEMRGEGEARLLVFREGVHTIALPILLREGSLPESMHAGNGYRDATSVHGYAGPLASPETPEAVRRDFVETLQSYCKSQGIVTIFSRLHPLMDQFPILEGYGEIEEVGATVSIDLTLPPEDQVAQYRKSNRYEIQRLRKMGFTCDECDIAHLDDFIRTYHETMSGLNADSYYYYDRDYFGYLLDDMSDIMHLFICKDGNTVACVGLFSNCNGIIQYHLAGTASEYRRLAPMKLMLDTVREWGIATGARTFHLGGGVGAKRDSLYEFKMSFGSREHGFFVWKHIVDQDLYGELCNELCRRVGVPPDESYFPMYRHPALQSSLPTR